jgi:hypothetical protein
MTLNWNICLLGMNNVFWFEVPRDLSFSLFVPIFSKMRLKV